MTSRTPKLNSLAVKERGKHYAASEVSKTVKNSSMTNRKNAYVGMPMESQSEDHKAPTMAKRGEYRRSGENKETPNSMTKRGKSYVPSSASRSKEPGDSYATNYEFKLEIGSYKIHCKSISNLVSEQELEEIVEGGNNEAPNFFTATKKKMSTLVIERALVSDKIAEAFVPGVRVKNGTISVLKNRKPFREIYFDEGIVTKCELSGLDALGREIMMHKLEIAHTGLY